MILNLGSLAFNANIDSGGGTPAWGTELGQGEGYKFAFEDMSDFFTGMVYKSIPDIDNVTCPLGKGGNQQSDYDFVIASIFDKIYVNGNRVNDARFLLLIVKKLNGDHHVGRRTIKYNPRMTYCGEYINDDCYHKMTATMGLPEDAAWFVYEIFIANQDELHFTAFELGQNPQSYRNNDERKNAFISKLPKDGKRPHFITSFNEHSLQQIYYGAPGTGKSYEITQKTKGSKDVVRTTFHPDSDYSTFVGAYKPTMGKGKVYGAQGPLRDNGKDVEEPKIVYEFVEQAFLQAYILAWEKYAEDHEEKQFLVIEEINRGNCAQIFGDIFQLLDRRKDGFSDYPINPDKDIRLHLKQKLENLSLTDIPTIDNIEGNDLGTMICKGEKMLLPPNLYIWATMNTSDQSLFPIDSAFKRRWDWKYMPIDTKKECWYIKVGNDRYSWTAFLEKVNNELLTDETAEDKHLGFYFCKAENNEIATEMFVGKVLFYLWNDVFKVYGIPTAIGSSKDWGYTKFYNPDGSVNEQKVADLMKQLKIEAVESDDDDANGQIKEQS